MLPVCAKPAPVKDWTGQQRSQYICRLSPSVRALIAHEMEVGAVVLRNSSRPQATALTWASSGYVASVRKLSDAEREQTASRRIPAVEGPQRPAQAPERCGHRASDRRDRPQSCVVGLGPLHLAST